MKLATVTAAIMVALIGASAAEEETKPAPGPKCLKAEINPVTGHILCIDPLGAPVEPPPERGRFPASLSRHVANGPTVPAARPSRMGCKDRALL
jgi:hypothetical protein